MSHRFPPGPLPPPPAATLFDSGARLAPPSAEGLCHGFIRFLPENLTLSGLPVYVARFPAPPLPVRSIDELRATRSPFRRSFYVTACQPVPFSLDLCRTLRWLTPHSRLSQTWRGGDFMSPVPPALSSYSFSFLSILSVIVRITTSSCRCSA